MPRSILLIMLAGWIAAAEDDWPVDLGETPQRTLELFAADRIVQAVDEHAGAAGLEHLAAADWFARWCYGADDLAGIDLQRPARFFWSAEGTVYGVIPLRERRRFLESFVGLPLTGADLIRTGERDGTVVYAYNGDDGIYEYRLLVRDGSAYLAPTVADCEVLAGHEWPVLQGEVPALVFEDRSPRPRLARWPLLEHLPAPALAVAQVLADRLAAESGPLRLVLRREEGGRRWQLAVDLTLHSDSDAADWLALQQNNASRLLPLMPADGGLLQLHGKLLWNGVLARAGEPIIATLTGHLTAEHRPQGWSEQLRLWFEQFDRLGAFAVQLQQETQGLRVLHAMRHEDVAALTLATEGLQRLYQPVLSGAGVTIDGDDGEQRLGDHPLRWSSFSRGDGLLLSRAQLTVDGTMLGALGPVPHERLVADCERMMTGMRARGAPAGQVALVAASLRGDRWLMRWADALGVPHGELGPVSVDLALVSDGYSRLRFLCELPLEQLARANSAVGLRRQHWVQILDP